MKTPLFNRKFLQFWFGNVGFSSWQPRGFETCFNQNTFSIKQTEVKEVNPFTVQTQFDMLFFSFVYLTTVVYHTVTTKKFCELMNKFYDTGGPIQTLTCTKVFPCFCSMRSKLSGMYVKGILYNRFAELEKGILMKLNLFKTHYNC